MVQPQGHRVWLVEFGSRGRANGAPEEISLKKSSDEQERKKGALPASLSSRHGRQRLCSRTDKHFFRKSISACMDSDLVHKQV